MAKQQPNPPAKGAPTKVRKMVLYIPIDLAKELKVYAAQHDKSMSSIVVGLIENEVKKGGKPG